MSKDNNFGNEERGSKNLPQYGKKGHKPRKPYSRPSMSVDDINTNDISYWNKTSGYNNVTKFMWDLIVGYPKDPNEFLNSSVTISKDLNPAQVMAIKFIPGPGFAENVKDGVNRSLSRVMAIIRSHLSTSQIGFETADLGIFFAATSSIAYNIGLAKRVLESTKVWEDRNLAYPRGLVAAQGFKWEDVAFNINQYVPRLNSLIDMYNAMDILDIFDIYDRQYSMTHNVFIDEDSEYAQMYIFQPEGYYVYDDTPSPENPYNMALWKFHDEYDNFDEFLDVIENQIYSWYNSSDLYQINGTLKKALKDAPRQSIPHYEDEAIKPVIDRAFLMQIMNATICGPGDIFGKLNIVQEPTTQNYVIWTPTILNPNNMTLEADSQILRLFENDVSQDDNMEMTRLMTYAYPTSTPNLYMLRHCGPEIVTQIITYSYDSMSDTLSSRSLNGNYVKFSDEDGAAQALIKFRAIASLQPFRYIPACHMLYEVAGTDLEYLGLVGDLYNWMSYPRSDYETLQFQALQSLWTPKNV